MKIKYYCDNCLDNFICYICENEYNYFFNKLNVVGIALGYKIKNGFNTLEKCIKVFVSKKLPLNQLSSKDIIPTTYKNVKTDVIESGILHLTSLTTKIRPALGGYSAGPPSVNYIGSLGCLVTDFTNYYILGNNHIFANSNLLPLRTPILQPAPSDNKTTSDNIIAELYKFIPIDLSPYTIHNINNTVDCALGKISNQSIVSSKIAFIGSPRGLTAPKLNLKVQKVGCISELTTGKITDLNGTFEMNFHDQFIIFKNQIITTPMATNGDSGAVLLDKNRYALGLLMSGNDSMCIYNNLELVLNQLNVKLVTN